MAASLAFTRACLGTGDSAARAFLKELVDVFYKGRMVLKKIRKSLRNAILEKPAQKIRSLLKSSTKYATAGLTAKRGSALKLIRKPARGVRAALECLHSERMNVLEAS